MTGFARLNTRNERGAMLFELAIVFAALAVCFSALFGVVWPALRRSERAEQIFGSIDRGINNPPYRLYGASTPPFSVRGRGAQLDAQLLDHVRELARDAAQLSEVRMDPSTSPIPICVRAWSMTVNDAGVPTVGEVGRAQSDASSGGTCTNAPGTCSEWAGLARGQAGELSVALTYDVPTSAISVALGLSPCQGVTLPSVIAGPITGAGGAFSQSNLTGSCPPGVDPQVCFCQLNPGGCPCPLRAAMYGSSLCDDGCPADTWEQIMGFFCLGGLLCADACGAD